MQGKYIKIAPSILSADFLRLGQQITEVDKAGADYIHIDVMDGHFVPNITIGVPIVQAIRSCTKLPLDVHLMISNPSDFIKQFAGAGASIITVHIECVPHLNRIVEKIKNSGVKAGIALNPSTPLMLAEEVISLVDLILLMTVNPGFGGQTFIPYSINKIVRLRAMLDEKKAKAELEVDGGINIPIAPQVKKAGADVIVSGNAIFANQNAGDALDKMRGALA
jgi:ribulose-phosphate 3-epimerase